jgi:membrane-associated phospholipid phosphatase
MLSEGADEFWRNIEDLFQRLRSLYAKSYSIPSDLYRFFVDRMKRNLLLFCFVSFSLGSIAQYGENSQISNPPYSFKQPYINETLTVKKNYEQWIVPGAMILYGFLTLHLDGLTDINENIKEEIWTEAPHNSVTIDTYLQFAPAIAFYGLNLSGVHGEHNLLDGTMIYALSNVIMGISVFSLKNITHEPRPDGSNDNSFPSGHTAEAFASAEFLRQEYKNVSVWYGIGGYLVAGSVAYLRLYNNKHWLGDVVAGAGFGIISTRLSYLFYPKIKKLFCNTKMNDSMVLPYYQDKTIGFSFIHAFK